MLIMLGFNSGWGGEGVRPQGPKASPSPWPQAPLANSYKRHVEKLAPDFLPSSKDFTRVSE